jgi:hypothetical protein
MCDAEFQYFCDISSRAIREQIPRSAAQAFFEQNQGAGDGTPWRFHTEIASIVVRKSSRHRGVGDDARNLQEGDTSFQAVIKWARVL